MGLEERIDDEMVVDANDVLEESFDRAKEVVRILQDGSVQLITNYRDLSTEKKILAHLIGMQYSFATNRTETPSAPYDYFYSAISADGSTVRHKMNDLEDENLVEKDGENDEWSVAVEKIDLTLDRITEGDDPS